MNNTPKLMPIKWLGHSRLWVYRMDLSRGIVYKQTDENVHSGYVIARPGWVVIDHEGPEFKWWSSKFGDYFKSTARIGIVQKDYSVRMLSTEDTIILMEMELNVCEDR